MPSPAQGPVGGLKALISQATGGAGVVRPASKRNINSISSYTKGRVCKEKEVDQGVHEQLLGFIDDQRFSRPAQSSAAGRISERWSAYGQHQHGTPWSQFS